MFISDLKEISPLIAAAIAATSTLLAVLITSRLNFKTTKLNNQVQTKQKAKELRISKIEDLYMLFDKWQMQFSNVYFYHLRCYMKKLTYAQTLEGISKLDLLSPGDYQKYKMIIAVHFPELAKEYEPVEKARSTIVPFLSDPKESKLSAEDFIKAQENFEKQSEIFKSKLSLTAHKILES